MSAGLIVILILASIFAIAVVAQQLVSRAFRRRALASVESVLDARPSRATAPADERDTELPPLWRAWLERSDASRLASVRGVRLQQRGEMRLSPDQAWMPFTAVETMSAERPEFAWFARVRMPGRFPAQVVDALLEGEGILEARVLGALTVAKSSGPEATQGELLRYLAELVWIPSALTRLPGLRFEQTSENRVTTRFELSGQHVELSFEFDGDGNPSRVRAPKRCRSPGEHLPWAGTFSDFVAVDGIVIPQRGEVAWELPEGPFVYWKGEMTGVTWK